MAVVWCDVGTGVRVGRPVKKTVVFTRLSEAFDSVGRTGPEGVVHRDVMFQGERVAVLKLSEVATQRECEQFLSDFVVGGG